MIQMKKLTIFACMLAFALAIMPVCEKPANADTSIVLSSENCVLMEYETGEILFQKNGDKRGQIASMTKIMLLDLIFEKLEEEVFSLEDEILVSQRAMSMGGSQVFLDCKNKYPAGELIKSIIVASANDSSVAMAEFLFGSVESAVDEMNKKAVSLGATNTNFVNVTGLPSDDAYSTAIDISKINRDLLSYGEYKNFSTIWLDKIQHSEGKFTEISNTNKLLRRYSGCDGGKTGFTNQAMHCISATAERNGMRFIATVMHGQTSKDRFDDAVKMFDYGFGSFQKTEIVKAWEPLELVASVKCGKESCVSVCPSESFYCITKKGASPEYIKNPILNKDVKAPIKKGDVVGEMEIVQDGAVVKVIQIVAETDIEKAGIVDNFKNMFPR